MCFCWFTSAVPLPPKNKNKKLFLRDHNGNKATQPFCVTTATAPRNVYFLFYIIVQFFDCRFIWKSYVSFSFIEVIFVMVKDVYWLTEFVVTSLGIHDFHVFQLLLSKKQTYFITFHHDAPNIHVPGINFLEFLVGALSITNYHSWQWQSIPVKAILYL